MRKSLVAVALVLTVLFLAACGGSGSSGSSTGDPGTAAEASSATAAEAAWTKEVGAVMSGFENNVSAQLMPQIQDTYNQLLLEPLYRTYSNYGGKLTALAARLDC